MTASKVIAVSESMWRAEATNLSVANHDRHEMTFSVIPFALHFGSIPRLWVIAKPSEVTVIFSHGKEARLGNLISQGGWGHWRFALPR